MRYVKNIFDELQSTNSKNDKRDIIKRNLSNDLFVDIMRFLLNNFIVTGISDKKINKKLNGTFEIKYLRSVSEAVQYLKSHNTGTDNDIATIQRFISDQPRELQETYKKIFTKSLKLGVDTTWNKSVPKELQIPTFEVMLAKKYSDHKNKVKGDFVITKKLDGNRLIVIKENGDVTSFTRTGKPYIGLKEIENKIKYLPIDNIAFDGELIADIDGATIEVFTETIKKARNQKDKNKTGLIFHIFDLLPVKEFKAGKSTKCAIERKEDLYWIFKCNEFKFCKMVNRLYIGSDKSMIDKWLSIALENGWEGIMINLDKPYECKRTDSLLKVKVMQTCDIKIIGFESGQGKYVNTLGNIIVEYKNNTVGVGSGFSDSQREEIWNNQDVYLGKVVEVQYFEETITDGLYSLRFPIFKGLREIDKKVSYN